MGTAMLLLSSSSSPPPINTSSINEINVTFVSRSCPPVPHGSYHIPTHLTRYGLSELINYLLSEDASSESHHGDDEVKSQKITYNKRSYDFLIHGEFLRTPLNKYLHEHFITGESGLTLEYVESIPSPISLSAYPHPDWIADITTTTLSTRTHHHPHPHPHHCVITACYDGTLRCYDTQQVINSNSDNSSSQSNTNHDNALLCTGIGHITSIQSISRHHHLTLADNEIQEHTLVASVSKDRTVRVWKLSVDEMKENGKEDNSVSCYQIAEGMSDSSLDTVEMNGSMLVTGGWNQSIDVYTLNSSIDWYAVKEKSSGHWNTSNKRQKIGAVKKNVSTSIQHMIPAHTLKNVHHDSITSLIMPLPHIIYSGSMDHTVKEFDLNSADPSQAKSHISCGYHAVTSMDYNADLNLIITGHNDNVIRCWDCRVNHSSSGNSSAKTEIMKFTFASHKGWVSDVKWRTSGNGNDIDSESEHHSVNRGSDTNEGSSSSTSNIHHFLSSSYDHTIKLFDIRATIPLHTIRTHSDKVLCVDWYHDTILSGGADSQLRSHRIT